MPRACTRYREFFLGERAKATPLPSPFSSPQPRVPCPSISLPAPFSHHFPALGGGSTSRWGGWHPEEGGRQSHSRENPVPSRPWGQRSILPRRRTPCGFLLLASSLGDMSLSISCWSHSSSHSMLMSLCIASPAASWLVPGSCTPKYVWEERRGVQEPGEESSSLETRGVQDPGPSSAQWCCHGLDTMAAGDEP